MTGRTVPERVQPHPEHDPAMRLDGLADGRWQVVAEDTGTAARGLALAAERFADPACPFVALRAVGVRSGVVHGVLSAATADRHRVGRY